MAQQSTIEWTDATWNPVIGCRKVSAGCKHCYAERMAKRLAAMASADLDAGRNPGKKAAYLNVLSVAGRWNGSVFLDERSVEEPLSWRAPRVIFVNSMSDLFHPDVPLTFISRILDVARRSPQHTYQVLTKRPERVKELDAQLRWPRNVWMGTSVENSAVVSRIRDLQATSAWVKFLSVEPLLGPIPRLPLRGIDWVIVGGESGPGARPMRPEWVRQIRDRCARYRVPFFFKQWGGPNKALTGRILDERTWDDMPAFAHQADS
jgi:protein gp37